MVTGTSTREAIIPCWLPLGISANQPSPPLAVTRVGPRPPVVGGVGGGAMGVGGGEVGVGVGHSFGV